MPKKEFKYRLLFFVVFMLALELIFWVLAWQILNVFGVFSSQSEGEQLHFLHSHYTWWFTLLPFLSLIFIYQLFRHNQLIEKLCNVKTLHTFIRPVSTK